MLLFSTVLFCSQLLVIFAVDEERCWSASDSSSARFWSHGDILTKDEYIYECRKGQLIPKGCQTPAGEMITIGGVFVHEDKTYNCVLVDGVLQVEEIGCAVDGETKLLGETWLSENGNNFWECRERVGGFYKALGGCVIEGKHLLIGEKTSNGNYTSVCKELSEGVGLVAAECVHEGKHYKVGQQWTEGDFIFYCKKSEAKCEPSCIGCFFNQRRLFNGDRFRRDNCVFECRIRPQRHSEEPVACVVDGIDRVVGCKWKEDMGGFRVEETCVQERDHTKVLVTGCHYSHENFDVFYIPANSYTTYNDGKHDLLVTCKGNVENPASFKLEKHEVNDLAKAQGLKKAEPQG